jgi:hypothetical protein
VKARSSKLGITQRARLAQRFEDRRR